MLEMLSIGLIIPLLNIALNPNKNESFKLLDKLSNFNFENNLLTVLIVFLALVFLIKTIFLIYFSWFRANFTQKLFAKISNKMLESYLEKDYQFHLNNNSSIMIKNITIEVGQFIYGSLNPVIILTTEICIFIGISIILFLNNPLAFIYTSVVFIFTTLIMFKFTRTKISKLGDVRHKYDGLRIKSINQSLNGIKPVILTNTEDFFLNLHKNYIKKTIQAGIWVQVYSETPRYIFELILIVTIASLFLFLLSLNYEINSIITTISLFGIASFKIIPSLNRALNQYQNITFNDVATKTILNIINSKNDIKLHKPKYQNTNKKNILSVQELSFYYKNGKKIFQNLNLTFPKYKIIGLVGKSGSGKSTFVDILTGLLPPITGGIFYKGKNINSFKNNWKRVLSYVPQVVYLLDDTIESNIIFGRKKNKNHREFLNNIFKQCQLTELINGLKDKEKTLVGERGARLSGGQIQRIGIARALYSSPKILILDESTSALDQVTEKEILNIIYCIKNVENIFIINHRLQSLDKCDLIYELKEGRFTDISKNVRKNI